MRVPTSPAAMMARSSQYEALLHVLVVAGRYRRGTGADQAVLGRAQAHVGGCISVARYHRRHDRGVDYAQPLHALHPLIVVAVSLSPACRVRHAVRRAADPLAAAPMSGGGDGRWMMGFAALTHPTRGQRSHG